MAGRRSKLSEKTWRRVFRWDRRGVPRRRLAELFGVTVGTIAYQAARRGLRKGETPGCVDRRRRPEGGWPDDHVFHQSGMTPARWRALLERRIAGEAVEDLAAEYGVSVGAITWQAKQMGMRKMDRPDARYLPRGPAQGAYGYSGIRDLLKITVDRDDPVGTVRRIDEAIWARLDKGDGSEAGMLWRHRRMVAQQLGITTPEVRARFEREVREQRLRLPAPEAFGRSSRVAGADQADRVPSTASRSPSPRGGEETREYAPGLVLHAHQRPPEGDWGTWLVLGGRGAGKTLAGASWVADQAARLGAGGRIALIGATLHDVRAVMIEGASGILNLPRWGDERPAWRPSIRTIRFPGGCEGFAFSAEDPDSLRGPQFHCAWADEFCAWAPGEGVRDALAMVRLGLRLSLPVRGTQGGEDAGMRGGPETGCEPPPPPPSFASQASDGPPPPRAGEDQVWRPQLLVTTTPRPTRGLKRLMGEAGVTVTRAGTAANAAHLAPGFVESLRALYGGTRLEAQEIEGQVVDTGVSLFTAEMMAACRGDGLDRYDRVVVGVDPSVTTGGHACGIVVVGRSGERAWVLADRTVQGVSPERWARAAVQAAADYGAAAIVAEVNQGGELVTGLLKAVGAGVTVQPVRASVGKRARAEPVAALYEQGRVVHAGAGLALLEEALMDFDGEGQDRADALVWAVTRLMLGEPQAYPKLR